MRISETVVSVRLTDDGNRVLEMAGLWKENALSLLVKESDQAGLWACVTINGAASLLLIRWEHVFSVEMREPRLRPRGTAR